MSESLKEHRPLLCEEFSDEELHPSHYCPQRRYQHGFKGRAKNKVKGAAAIITRWPEYWSSSVLFWWIIVGMSLLLVMMIYNTIVALVLIPSAHSLPFATESNKELRGSRPHVNMHVFIDEDEIVDLKHYLPFINKLTDKYEDFNYNFIVLLNDSSTTITNKIIEDNNIHAMNEILSDNVITRRDVGDVSALKVRHVLLSEYLNDSPLKNKWRKISAQFLPFLVRAVSVWENGGIAIDPLILTPLTPNPIYSEKLNEVMVNFARRKRVHTALPVTNGIVQDHHTIPKKRVNNIQEIIDASDGDERLKASLNLSEAEDQVEEDEKSFSRSKKSTKSEFVEGPLKVEIKSESDPKTDKAQMNAAKSKGEKGERINKRRSPVIANALKESHRPVIVLPDDDGTKLIHSNHLNATGKNTDKLIVDLKGNFLASETGCNAFIGAIFNAVLHRSDFVNVSDLIIQELSKFCNGILTSCEGIDVILV